MTSLPLFAFLTGLHLALLQFSYFFLLAINVTATYVTYAAVVMSWMAGTLLGLLWPRLLGLPTMMLGVGCYYSVYFLVLNGLVAPYEILAGAVGVMGSGLWAGRFFIDTLPLFSRADRLFFHENNGFLVGIVGVFIGFTMLGRHFLQWTPLVSGVFVLAHLAWLKAYPPKVINDQNDTPRDGGADSADGE